jgi:hypothetical protein
METPPRTKAGRTISRRDASTVIGNRRVGVPRVVRAGKKGSHDSRSGSQNESEQNCSPVSESRASG